MRLLKILIVLLVAAFLTLTGYAYLGDMAPRQQEMRQPVNLEAGRAAPPSPAAGETAPEQPSSQANGTDANAQE